MAAGPARPGRGMKRRLLNLLTVLSLVLCVATVVLWVRSYQDWLYCSWSRLPDKVIVHVSRGAFVVSAHGTTDGNYHVVQGFQAGRNDPSDVTKRYVENVFAGRSAAGFVVGRVTNPEYQYSYVVGAPLWSLLILFGAVPALTLASRNRRRRRLRLDHCVGCGYDLRATPGRCPECGGVGGRAAG